MERERGKMYERGTESEMREEKKEMEREERR